MKGERRFDGALRCARERAHCGAAARLAFRLIFAQDGRLPWTSLPQRRSRPRHARSPTASSSTCWSRRRCCVLLLIGMFPLVYTAGGELPEHHHDGRGHLVQRAASTTRGCSRRAPVGSAAAHRDLHRDRAAARAGARHGDGAAVPRAHARPPDLRRAAGAAGGDLADRRGRDLAADVRQPLRSDQPDPRLDRGRAGDAPVDRSTRPRLSGDHRLPRSGSGRRSCSCCCSPALSNVDQSQLEAAEIDGAGYWRTSCAIVLPAIWPVMAIALLIRGARPGPPVRHRLGADQGRPRHA